MGAGTEKSEVKMQNPERRTPKRTRGLAALAIAVVGLAGVLVAGPLVVTRRIERRVPLAGCEKAIILHRYGNVAVTGTGDARALIDALVRVTAADRNLADEYARRIDVRAAGQGDSFVIATFYPPDVPADPQFGYEVELNIRIPAATEASVQSSFGDVIIAGMDGECRVSNRFGDVEIDRCARCSVDNSYGRVRLVETRGLAKIRNSYGDVDVREAAGPVQVTNRYGSVRTGQSEGEVRIDNRFGNVVALPDHGRLMIVNRYGDVDARVASTDLSALDIVSRLGRVDLRLTGGIPFQLDANALQGQISSGFPFVVREVGTAQLVSARQGTGGPRIGLDGVWSNFVIHPDTAGSHPAAGPNSKEER